MTTGQFKERNTRRAQSLRREATPAERASWRALSGRKVGGCKFSGQRPLGPWFVDFLCREIRLVIEGDGFSHDLTQTEDAARTADLERHGFQVMRFSNAEVLGNLQGVALAIETRLAELAQPYPLPHAGGGTT